MVNGIGEWGGVVRRKGRGQAISTCIRLDGQFRSPSPWKPSLGLGSLGLMGLASG